LYMYATADLANSRPLLPPCRNRAHCAPNGRLKLPTLDAARTGEGPCRAAQATQGTGPVQGRERSHSEPSSTPATGNLSAPWQGPPRGGPAGPGGVGRMIRMQLRPSQPSHPAAAKQAALGPARQRRVRTESPAQLDATPPSPARPAGLRTQSAQGSACRPSKHAGSGRVTSIAGCDSSQATHASGPAASADPRQRHRRSSPPIGAAGIVGKWRPNK